MKIDMERWDGPLSALATCLVLGLILSLLVGVPLVGALDNSDTFTMTVKGTGEMCSYGAVKTGNVAAKSQISGTASWDVYQKVEWNSTGTNFEIYGTVDPTEDGAITNHYITGVYEKNTGVHRLETSNLGVTTFSSSMQVDTETLSSMHTIDATNAYLENVVETANYNVTHLADRTRTYYSGDINFTFDYVAVVPPGAGPEKDWLSCIKCVDDFGDDQPDWEEEIEEICGDGGKSTTCEGGTCEVDPGDEIVVND